MEKEVYVSSLEKTKGSCELLRHARFSEGAIWIKVVCNRGNIDFYLRCIVRFHILFLLGKMLWVMWHHIL